MKLSTLLTIATLFLATTDAAHGQDVTAGETLFLGKCDRCHAIGEGARHKIGPLLNGLEGHRSGTIEGYSYTEANKAADITWDDASFKDYIIDPRIKIPGTRMIFGGVKNPREIADLWAYLKQFSPDGKKK
jgi:cytochrome c